MQDQDLNQELLEISKVIDRSTSRVSLKDLERKGFKQVRVLRASNINQMIAQAVRNVLAKVPRGALSEQERQKLLRDAKMDFGRQQQEQQRLRDRIQDLSKQLVAAREGSGEGQEAMRKRYADQLEDMELTIARYRKQVHQLESDNDAMSDSRSKTRDLQDENDQLRAQLSGTHGDSQSELQRMRMQVEQGQSQMRDMLAGIADSLVSAQGSPDMSKQFDRLQRDISDAVRKAAGGIKGGDMDLNLTTEQVAMLFSVDTSTLETNINEVEIKEHAAGNVSDKLARLRNLRKR